LAILLAVAQLLSWNAAPLYLCRCASGSVCLHSGPEKCTCCSDSSHEQDLCCDNGEDGCGHECCTPGDRPCSRGDAAQTILKNRVCDCVHVLLLGSQAPCVVVSATGSTEFKLAAAAFDAGLSRAATASFSGHADPVPSVHCAHPSELSMTDAGPVVL